MTASTRRRRTTRNLHTLDTVRALVYVRASLDATGERGSVKRQATACRGLITARGWAEVELIEDNSFSAYDDDKQRPGWERVLSMVANDEVDVIVAWHFDRVTRSMRALEKLIEVVEQTNVGIATAVGDIDLSTDTGRMVARILTAVARAEVERKAARQMLANDQRAEAGLPWTGGPRAFGYQADGMTLNEAEATAFGKAVDDALNGVPMREIALTLSESGLTSSRSAHSKAGNGWTSGGVRKMLINPRYAGIRMHVGEIVGKGAWPALIDEATHNALVRKLTDPTRDPLAGRTRNSRVPSNLLSKIARCECGDFLIATAQRDKLKYGCRSGKGCLYAPRDELDREVEAAMVALMSKPNFLAALAPNNDKTVAAARRQGDKLRDRLAAMRTDYKAGLYDDDPAGYREDRKALLVELGNCESVVDEASDLGAFRDFDFGDVAASWNAASLERKRTMVERLVSVTVRPQGNGRIAWTAERCLTLDPLVQV